MSLPRFSVRNPVAVNLLMVGRSSSAGGSCVVLGLVREFFPSIEAEQVLITVPYPGATPEEIERSRHAARRARDRRRDRHRRRSAPRSSRASRSSRPSSSRTPIATASLNDLRGEMDKVIPDLPDGAEEPEILEARPYIPVIAVVLHGGRARAPDARRGAEGARRPARHREHHGGRHHGLPQARDHRSRSCPTSSTSTASRSSRWAGPSSALNRDIPGGQLKGGEAYVRVRTDGRGSPTPAEIEKKIILTTPGRLHPSASRTGGARAATASRTRPSRARFQAVERACRSSCSRRPSRTRSRSREAVRSDYVDEKKEMLGGALKLDYTTDLSRFIEGRIDLMQRNATHGV